VPAPETVNLVSPDGQTVSVPIDHVAGVIQQGFHVERPEEATERVGVETRTEGLTGAYGGLASGLSGLASGASLGLSDLALSGDVLSGSREAHPSLYAGGQLVGSLAPAFMAPESLLGATPAGAVAGMGSRIIGAGEGLGLGARLGYAVAGGAAEGALYNAGSYISSVALGDQPLSAEGFIGSMGKGALWGGVGAGALTLTSAGLTAARRLFPTGEATEHAVQSAETAASNELQAAVGDGQQLQRSAKDALRNNREQRAAMDVQLKARLDEIKVQKARDLADLEVQGKAAEVGVAAPRKARRALAEEPIAEKMAKLPQPPAAEAPADDLMAQLQGTKALADKGVPLSAMKRAHHIEDALDDAASVGDPAHAKLAAASRDMRDAQEQLDAWLGKYGPSSKVKGVTDAEEFAQRYGAGARQKYVANDTSGMPMSQFNATREKRVAGVLDPAERAAKQATSDNYMRFRPTLAEDILSGKKAIGDIGGIAGRRVTADEIMEASNLQLTGAGMEPLGQHIEQALRARVDDFAGDLDSAAKVIGNYERASANLADTLGPAAPPGAVKRAEAFNAAVDGQGKKMAQATAEAASKASPAVELTKAGTTAAAAPSATAGVLGKLTNAGALAETLHMLGAHIPSVSAIPVVGPVLSLFLKAKALSKVWRRIGGKLPETAETMIATKAAATQQRAMAAVDRMMELGARATKAAAPGAAAVTTALSHQLFDHRPPPGAGQRGYTSVANGNDDALTLFRKRAEELSQASVPGAIRESVSQRVKTSDPSLLDHIVSTMEKKLSFLASKLPKPAEPGGLLDGANWMPARSTIAKFARYVDAAEDPAGVLERAADGGQVTLEETETLRAVYPEIYAKAQARLLDKATDGKVTMPYARRIQMSLLFDVPLDRSTRPDYAAFLQASYQPAPPAAPPQMPPMTPTIQAPINLGDRMSTDLDRRAGGQ
jgi:hypothetical protein